MMPQRSFSRSCALAVAVLLFANTAAHGQAPRRVTLDGKDGAPDLTPAGGNYIGSIATPQLELFAATRKPSRGIVLVLPGGGYSHLAFNYEGENVARWLNAAGWDAAVLFYRLGEGAEARTRALEDANQAFALLKTRGRKLGFSAERVGVIGFSAGGHLAARLAHETAGDRPPSFVVLGYPAYLETGGKLHADVGPTNAPTFACVGSEDRTFRPGAEAYVAACKAAGIRCESFIAEGAGHGFGITDTLPAGAREWPGKLRAFLDSLAD